MTTKLRRVGAAGLAFGVCLGAAGSIPASATTDEVPAVGGVLGAVDGGLLGGLVGGLLHGEGGIFGHEGGVLAGDDELGDVIGGFGDEAEIVDTASDVVEAVGDVVAAPNIGGEDSFGDPTIGTGLLGRVLGEGTLGGVLGGLLNGGTGLLGGVF